MARERERERMREREREREGGGSHGSSAHKKEMTPGLYCIAEHSHLHLMKASVAGVALRL